MVAVPEIDNWLKSHGFPPKMKARVTTSYWRFSAREIIDKVLADTQGQEAKARLKAIDAAYPFGEREQWPYKCWLIERRATMVALGLSKST